MTEDKESLSIRALAIFTFPERTCHVHRRARLCPYTWPHTCACARAVLEGAGRCTRMDAGRGRDAEPRGNGREVVASSKRDAMGKGEGDVGNAAAAGGGGGHRE